MLLSVLLSSVPKTSRSPGASCLRLVPQEAKVWSRGDGRCEGKCLAVREDGCERVEA